MTEQEKREKAIEEIIQNIINNIEYCGQHKQEIDKMYEDIKREDCLSTALPYMFCIYSSKAGYRKEEEVRKETLQKLFKAVKENVFDYGKNVVEEGILFAIDIDTLAEIIAEKFGVEVEE